MVRQQDMRSLDVKNPVVGNLDFPHSYHDSEEK